MTPPAPRPIAPCGCDAYRWIDCGWCYNPDCAAETKTRIGGRPAEIAERVRVMASLHVAGEKAKRLLGLDAPVSPTEGA